MNAVRGATSIAKDKADFVTLSFQDIDPKLAARVARFYVENLEAINEELDLTTEKPMVKVIDAAEEPIRKFKPSRSRLVIISFILSWFLGIFASFFLEFIKNIKENN
jgi:uncharacterized protein involved in exopolysaccharide biosynthesis